MDPTMTSVPVDAPQFLEMVRSNDPNIIEQDANSYVQTLTNKEASSGCYVIKCMRPCIFSIACAYNCSCNWCLWTGIKTLFHLGVVFF